MLQFFVTYIGIQISYHFGVDLIFSKSSLQNKPKCKRKNPSGLHLFLCTWMTMTDSIMLSTVVFKGKYPTRPFSQFTMQLMRTYQNIVHLDAIVKSGPTSFVDYCIYNVSRIFCINILLRSRELEANNLDFCLEDHFKTRVIVESRNFISLNPDFSFIKCQSLWRPICIFSFKSK